VTGEIGEDGNVLVIQRIHVHYHLKVEPSKREVAEKVLGFHADYCPAARTIRNCVTITTALDMEDI
jgi:uncharacterized OsmC-like protein